MSFRKIAKPRTSRIEIRLLPEEAEAIMRKAHMCCVTVSDYLRKCALGRRLEARFDSHAILELDRINRNLSFLRDAIRERPDLEFDEEILRLVAVEVMAAVNRLI